MRRSDPCTNHIKAVVQARRTVDAQSAGLYNKYERKAARPVSADCGRGADCRIKEKEPEYVKGNSENSIAGAFEGIV